MTTATHWIPQVVVVVPSAPWIFERVVGLKNWRAKQGMTEVGAIWFREDETLNRRRSRSQQKHRIAGNCGTV